MPDSAPKMTALERRALAVLASLYGVRMLGLFMILPVLPLYMGSIPGATPVAVGLAIGSYGLSQALLQYPFGWLSDRYGRRPLLLVGLSLFVAGSVLAALSQTITGIIVGRLLQGSGAIAGVLLACLGDQLRAPQRMAGMTVIGIVIGASFLAALILGPLLLPLGGPQAVFVTNAALGLLGCALVLALLPGGTPALASSPKALNERAAEHRPAGEQGSMLGWCGVAFSLHLALTAAFVAIPGVLWQQLGHAPASHWKIYAVVLPLSALPMLWLARRRRRPDPALLPVAALASALALGLLALAPTTAVPGLLLFFAGFNLLEAALPALMAQRVPPRRRGAMLGLFSSAQFLGAFGGGLLGGTALQWGGAEASFALGAILLCGWLPWLWRNTKAQTGDSLGKWRWRETHLPLVALAEGITMVSER